MYNYNFTGPAALKALSFAAGDERNNAVKLLNPFGEDQSLMRTTLYMGMLDSAARNIRRKTGYGRFMEVGNVHFDLGGDALPREEKKIGLVFFGGDESFYTLKGVVETLLARFGIKGAKYERNGIDCFQPGRRADVTVSGKKLGELGQVHPDVLDAWDVPGPVYMAELSFASILALSVDTPAFQPLPRFPVVSRDLAIVVPEDSESAHWIEIIETAPVDVIVEKGRLFDVFRGPAVGLGKKSLAITFNLRAEDHTLTDEEIKKAFETIIRVLAENGAPLRQ
jgi:phenylalanyl-tRNA synthetase beta chain